MAQTGVPEPSKHAFNSDVILGAFADGDNGIIYDVPYEIRSISDPFKSASSPEKRDRLLGGHLKRKDSFFEAALACMLFQIRKVHTLTRYAR